MRRLSPANRNALRGLLAILLGVVSLTALGGTKETKSIPHWIWFPEENPGAVTRYFRLKFQTEEPDAKLTLDVTADNGYVLYLDGKEVSRGDNWALLNRVKATLPPGPHVLAASATNEAPGAAAFLAQGSVASPGRTLPLETRGAWRTARIVPSGDAWTKLEFDDSKWLNPTDLGALGTGPWQGLAAEGADPSERFKVPEGFKVSIVAGPSLTGSAVVFTFDEQGAPVVGAQGGPVVRLIDEDKDGVYDDKIEIAPALRNCQGLAVIKEALWAVGDGPKGAGLYQLTDTDADGVFETVALVRGTNGGMGEHGPHAVALGPDGCLYYNNGNHAHLKPPIAPGSPANIAYEGELLPHYNDSNGHAAGILAPCGEIYRSADGGKTWERVVEGFRNQYDFAFNRDGEIFSFDSDMEWDIGLPWYRPVRVNHCPPGADLGSRNGSAAEPEYFFDTLPATLDVGRGSPTGVTFYQGNTFPKEYDDNFLICDWSQGRILAIELTPSGGSYTAKPKELVTGQPLNCTDIEVGPDGAVYFTTGGRGTRGGLFKVQWTGGPRESPASNPDVANLLRIPFLTPGMTAALIDSPLSSFSSAKIAALKAKNETVWSRSLASLLYLGIVGEDHSDLRVRALDLSARFGPSQTDALLAKLSTQEERSPAVRAKAVQLLGMRQSPIVYEALKNSLADPDALVRRRAAEALVRSGGEIPVKELLPLLDDGDRWVRYAARIAIEHAGPEKSREALLAGKSIRAQLEGMLILVRATKPTAAEQEDLLAREIALLQGPHTPEEGLDLYRLIGLTFLAGPQTGQQAKAGETLRPIVLKTFTENTAPEVAAPRLAALKSGDPKAALRVNLVREQARMLAYLDEPKAVAAILAHQRTEGLDRPSQIFDAYCLRAMKAGWTTETRREFWAWLDTASHWDGGFSYLGYLDFMAQDLLATCSPEERASLLADAAKTPFPTRVLVRALDLNGGPEQIMTLANLYHKLGDTTNPKAAADLRALIIDRFGQSAGPAAHAALVELAGTDLARRDLVARALANHPAAVDLPILVAALESKDANTTSVVLNALSKLDAAPEGPEGLRNLILLARRTGPTTVAALNQLAGKWTGVNSDERDLQAALSAWEKVYAERFPDGPPLSEGAAETHHYTLAQLVSSVIDAGLVKQESAERGKAVLTEAKCLNCHKLGDQGQGLGPDLTTVSSRFRPVEVLESIVEPSKVISDQYKPVQVAMTDGKVYNGMPSGGDDKTLVLLLSDGSKVNLPKAEIDEQAESQVSVMPEGLLNALSPQEIGALLSLFEAQPKVEVHTDGKE